MGDCEIGIGLIGEINSRGLGRRGGVRRRLGGCFGG